MFATIAAVLFGLALILQLLGTSIGTLITTSTLTTAGLLFLALHLGGFAGALRGRGRRWTR
jgi:hypothetical protein